MPEFLCTMTAFVIVFLRNWAWVLMENGWKMNGGNTIINHCFYSWSDPFSLVWYHKWCATASFPQFGLHYFNLDTDYSLLTGKIIFWDWLIDYYLAQYLVVWGMISTRRLRRVQRAGNKWWYKTWRDAEGSEKSEVFFLSLFNFFCRRRNM